MKDTIHQWWCTIKGWFSGKPEEEMVDPERVEYERRKAEKLARPDPRLIKVSKPTTLKKLIELTDATEVPGNKRKAEYDLWKWVHEKFPVTKEGNWGFGEVPGGITEGILIFECDDKYIGRKVKDMSDYVKSIGWEAFADYVRKLPNQ